ncbi:OLC1v1000513C1 [Oldenlandia corymbosa var. corymbosa]|uniref:OLC1v1000513C1 n=1 Tax=Oldenlandia corymbosa var. corymbosa TaxID=529605 RepID=A0AAV1D424_OLDCO|nr:OLC1v1000513C1 [Oldenlandia corymbosa var. corymbosa]
MMAQHEIDIPSNQLQGDVVNDDPVRNIFSRLQRLQILMDEAERRSIREKVAREWLEKFIKVTDKVEDWWDEFRVITSQKSGIQVEEDISDDEEGGAKINAKKKMSIWFSSSLKKVRSSFSYLSSLIKNDSNDHIASKTKDLIASLDNILEEAARSNVFDRNGGGGGSSSSSQSPAILGPNFGESQPVSSSVSDLLQILVPDVGSSNNRKEEEVKKIRMISLPAEWGSENTTIVKQLFNDKKVKEYFDVRRWINVPSGFEPAAIANNLLGERQEEEEEESREEGPQLPWDSLLRMIEEYFRPKRFLFVLEDVDLTHCPDVIKLMMSLRKGVPRSTILVTSRVPWEKLRTELPYSVIYNPAEFSPQKGWKALRDNMLLSQRPDFSARWGEIGEGIVTKCGGMKFNIKIIQSHLQFKDTMKEWEQVLHHEIWEMEDVKKLGYGPLYISYSDLTVPLQRCFLSVASLGCDAVINVENLIRLWMGEGYLGPPNQTGDHDKKLEMKGLQYFNQLVSRSFFYNLVKSSVHKDKIISFQMDVRVHGFAQWLLHKETPTSSNGHDSSLIPYPRYRSLMKPSGLSPEELSQFKNVRMLDLSYSKLRKIPREIRNLILVQYLNLSGNPLKRLPGSICDLSYLEFLDVHLCYMLSKLPERIGKLERLRHLRIDHTTDELQNTLPKGFKKLSTLRTLDVFRAGGEYSDIAALVDFDDLEEICIVIHGKVLFEDAKLHRKNKMKSLELCFVGEGRGAEAITFVRASVPPPNLEMLKFEGYHGLELPSWAPQMKNLKRLTVRSALKLSSLPDLWKMPSLEFLWLDDLPGLERIDRKFLGLSKIQEQSSLDWVTIVGVKIFPRLKTLRIECLEKCEIWEDINEHDVTRTLKKISVMTKLEELIINDCPKLIVSDEGGPKADQPKLPRRMLTRINSNLKLSINGTCYTYTSN